MKFDLVLFILVLGTDLVCFSRADDVTISNTANSSTISDPEDGSDSSGQLLDADLADYLENSGDLRVRPTVPFTPDTGDITVLNSTITWTTNSTFTLLAANGDINLIGPVNISSTNPDARFSIDSRIFTGGRESAERRLGQGNTATSRMVVNVPTVDVDVDGDFNHSGTIDSEDNGSVTVSVDGHVFVGDGGGIKGGSIIITAMGDLNVDANGEINGKNVMIMAQTVNFMGGNVSGSGSCGQVTEVGTGNITNLDTDDPEITCPDDKTVVANGDSANVTFDDATVTDNCDDDPTVSTDIASGSNFPVGTTTVTATATDDAGNSATCSFSVTVISQDCGIMEANGTITNIDMEPPTITCPDEVVVFVDKGASEAAATFSPTATDNCDDNPTIVTDVASGSNFPPGTTTVTATATDAAGNVAMCSFAVAVAFCPAGSSLVRCGDGTNQAVHRWDKLFLCFEKCEPFDGTSFWTVIGFVCGQCDKKSG